MQQPRVRESLYLDSELVARCGIFYVVITKGKITTSVNELEKFNKDWAVAIKNKKGYEDFYLAIKIEKELEQLADYQENGTYQLSQAGIAEVLSSVQKYQVSSDDAREFLLILNTMIKENIKKTKLKQRQERIKQLSIQLEKSFDLNEPESFNTQYDGDQLAIHILQVMATIYNTGSHEQSKAQEEIGEMIRQIKERERRFHSLLEKASNNEKIDSKNYMEVAKAIRQSKIEAYKSIYENIICQMDDKCIERFKCDNK